MHITQLISYMKTIHMYIHATWYVYVSLPQRLHIYVECYGTWRNNTLLLHWWRIGIELEVTYGDLEVIQGNKDSMELCAAAMLNKWLNSGSATKQALVEAVQVVK